MKLAVGILDEVIKTEPVDTSRVYLRRSFRWAVTAVGISLSESLSGSSPTAPICGGGDDTKAYRLVVSRLVLAPATPIRPCRSSARANDRSDQEGRRQREVH